MFRPVGRISNLAGGEISRCFCCDQTGSSARSKKDVFFLLYGWYFAPIHRLLQNLWRKQVCFLSGETNLWIRTCLKILSTWRLEEEAKGDGESREGVNWVKVLPRGGGCLRHWSVESVDYEKTESWIIQCKLSTSAFGAKWFLKGVAIP